ncbi:DUF58 domain-containing protein [bacterium]|jgi:uncharacterized protein (DUF58 family)|nr:DUF58 domain-containing protein [bacterium]
MEQNLHLKNSRIRIRRAGVYLFLFASGLGSTTFVTGANLLVLLDFFLFSVLAFNFFYLLFLRRGVLALQFPTFLVESQPAIPQIRSLNPLPPFAGTLTLIWERFSQTKRDSTSVLHFSQETRALPIRFSLRGPYKLQSLKLEVEFPFPLFSLELELSTCVEILVAPLAASAGMEVDDSSFKSMELEGEVHKIKNYLPGDPLKLISWKHYAKFGDLMVKEFDRISLEEVTYVIKYSQESERRVFSRALCYLQHRMENLEPFTILGNGVHYRFDGNLKDQSGLLRFLAIYRTPAGDVKNATILGSSF